MNELLVVLANFSISRGRGFAWRNFQRFPAFRGLP